MAKHVLVYAHTFFHILNAKYIETMVYKHIVTGSDITTTVLYNFKDIMGTCLVYLL